MFGGLWALIAVMASPPGWRISLAAIAICTTLIFSRGSGAGVGLSRAQASACLAARRIRSRRGRNYRDLCGFSLVARLWMAGVGPSAKMDGSRILVDRLWPRGLRRETAALTSWFKDVAPSTELRRWFGHDPQRWAEFNRRYRKELEVNPVAVAELTTLLNRGHSTLLYAARDEQHTPALVLAGFMAEHR